jgi:hypothetical protein
MATSDIHSAASSMAGFIFQLDRALTWLAKSELGSAVGVESLDDVVMISPGGAVLEQDKLSWVRNPIPDRSENLWKTLAIWLGLIRDGERELKSTQFHLVSTFQVNTGVAAALKLPPQARDTSKIIETLRALSKAPNDGWAVEANFVTLHSDEDLSNFLDHVLVIDHAPATDLDGANDRLATAMQLPLEIAADVIAGLRGWLQSRVMEQFRRVALGLNEKAAAWIESDEFRRELAKLVSRHFQDKPIIRAASQITISPELRQHQTHAMFVRQLEILGITEEEPERIIEAIEDFLKGVDERSRLALQNGVTQQVFENYEASLVDHWKTTKRIAARKKFETEEITGQEILDQSLSYQAHLDGHLVTESYLTKGTFHKLANSPAVILGWHPRFKEMLTSAQ